MILNHVQIKKQKLIENFDEAHFKNASYDLRVDKIISVDGVVHEDYSIAPNSMVVVVSKEKVILEDGIIGHAFVKTRLSQKGIMANNIGIVDPQYKGYLSSVLVNYGKEPYEIVRDDTFLRLTFSKYHKLTNKDKIPLGYGPFEKMEYLNNQRSDALTFLGNTFLNTKEISDSAANEVKRNIRRILKHYSYVIGLVAFLITVAVMCYRLFNEVDVSNEYKNYVNQISILNNTIHSLEIQQESLLNTINANKEQNLIYQKRIDSLIKNHSVNSLKTPKK